MQYTREQLGERFEQLPENVQETIIAVETAKIVSSIGNKYTLHVDQVGELADEIGLVMLGFVHPNEFVTHIIARIGVDHIVAEAMAKEVNEQIFLKIRESLQELNGEVSVSNDGVEPIPGPRPASQLPIALENLPSKEEITSGIENPKKEDSVFEQKMGKLFRIPREEIDLDPYLEKPK